MQFSYIHVCSGMEPPFCVIALRRGLGWYIWCLFMLHLVSVPVHTEVFTSANNLKQLYLAEQDVVQQLEHAIHVENERIRQLTRYVGLIYRSVMIFPYSQSFNMKL